MRLIILKPFRDRNNFLHEYKANDVIDVDEVRGERILSLGYGKLHEQEADATAPVDAEKETDKQPEPEVKEEETPAEPEVKEETSSADLFASAEDKAVPQRKSRKASVK